MTKKPLYSALLVGATGLVGTYCLQALLADPHYSSIVVLSRRPLPVEHPKLKTILVDFKNLAKHSEQMRADHIFCCLGTTIKVAGSQANFRQVDFNYPYDIARRTVQDGAKQFLLVSSVGASSRSKIFYNRVKGELEDALIPLPFQGVLIFRPSLILGKRPKNRPGEGLGKILMGIFKPFLVSVLKKYRPIQARVIGESMVEMAKIDLKGSHIFESDQIQFFYDRLDEKIR
jgi:uncharacterized protein YbjT (DUF2867 family)